MRDSSEVVWLVHRSMVAAGVDVDAVYQRLGYDLRDLPLGECRPSNALQPDFWQAVEAVTDDPDIGLRLCPYAPLFRGAGVDYLLIASARLGDGMQLVFRYARVISDALSIRLAHGAEGAYIAVTGQVENAAPVRHTEMLYAYQCLKLLRLATDYEFVATRVRLCCSAISDTADYEAVFGCPVEFDSDVNEIHFPDALLDWRSPHADADLLDLHQGHVHQRMQAVARHDRMDELYQYLLSQFEATGGPGGENEAAYSLTEVACAVGLSSRRLRFELAEAGTCYRDLLVRAKIAHAKKLLGNGRARIGEVADSVGFTRRQTFVRTFRQETGLSPSEYREQNG